MVLLLSVAPVLGAAGGEHHDVDQGRTLFLANCARCHGIDGTGGGPDATALARPPTDLRRSSLLDDYPDEVLVRRIRDGRMHLVPLRPEELRQRAKEAESLYAFLTRIPAVDWRAADRGKATYLERCAVCHGWYGHPTDELPSGVRRPPDLVRKLARSSLDDRKLGALVRHGKSGMPALTPRITDAEARDVTDFVRLLSPGYQIFDGFCSACHGPHGEGAAQGTAGRPHFAFDRDFFRVHEPDHVRRSIWHMLDEKLPTMPHFAESLDPNEVVAILSYLRSLPHLPGGSIEH